MSELEQIQAGNQVVQFHYHAYGRERFTLETVERTTKTQVIVGKQRFRRKDGYQLGEKAYRSDRIEPATGAAIQKMNERTESDRLERRRLALSAKLRAVVWRRVGIEQLEAVREALGMEVGE